MSPCSPNPRALAYCVHLLSVQAASYEFTTLTCVPGIVRYRGAKIQMLDLPGIIEGAKDGKGRGRQVISTARTCNLILIVLDCLKPLTHKKVKRRGKTSKEEGWGGDPLWGGGGGWGSERGGGEQVISTTCTCNLILIVLDCLKPLTHKKVGETSA